MNVNRIGRRLVVLVVVSTLALAWSAQQALADTNMLVRGTVRCSNGQAAVGVWIASSGGDSKFAPSWAYPGQGGYRYFETTIKSKSAKSKISVHAGCGGTAKSWTKDLYSAEVSVNKNGKVLNLACNSKAKTRTVACVSAPRGPVRADNGGFAGYCTWGAKQKWRDSTGDYPNINGDAKDMDEDALRKKFYVWTIPHVRSMVVFNNMSKWGHIGWVTRVYLNKKKQVLFDYWDMNGGTNSDSEGRTTDFNKFVKRTGRLWDNSQRFILAPN